MKAIAKILPGILLVAVAILPPASNAAKQPQAVIRQTADQLIEVLKTRQLKDARQLKQIVDDVLSPSIDFRRIAYRSMGKHYKKASTQQFLAFTEAVKTSLINTYSGPLLESDAQELASKLTVEIRGVKPVDGDRPRAVVSTWLKVGANEKYDVVYFMYLNTKKDLWLVENLSVEGIDLGITFRNQYQRLISESQGDIDKVTEIWAKSRVEG